VTLAAEPPTAPSDPREGMVVATYRLESWHPLERAAAAVAAEQSTGTFVRIPGETDALRARHAARILSLEARGTRNEPSLPGAQRPEGASVVNVGRVEIGFPLENFGTSLPNVLAAVAGNVYELGELAGCRLLDIELPQEFAVTYPGPSFGIAGTRRLMGRPRGALVGGIVKPSVGLRPVEQAQLVSELALAGADFCKDDELIANPPYSPLRVRVREVMEAINRAADRTGRKLMYAFNITDDIGRLRENHDVVVEAGGTCVMVCVNIIGLAGLIEVARFTEVPIHGHRAMYGLLARHPALGIDFRAWQKLARLAGADHLHTSGMHNKFYETDDEVEASIRAVHEPMLGGYECLPVLSSAQWAGSVPLLWSRIATTDVLMVAGGGIFGHPDGIAAGVRSIREAWEATEKGISLREYSQGRSSLGRALEWFGSVRN
jgi:ribulose-bisphosphate carboxylase large chain